MKTSKSRKEYIPAREWISNAKLKVFKRYEVELFYKGRMILPSINDRFRIVDPNGSSYFLSIPPNMKSLFAKKIAERHVECERLLAKAGI